MRSALWCCILVACICFGVATAATTVTFGQSAAFTGLNGQLGLEMRKGLLSAFKEVNDAGGIKGDLLFDLVSYDDAYEPANTTVNTERLISQDNVFGLIGYVGTATTQAALKVRQTLDSDMPIIAPATGSMVFRLPTDPSIINIRASYLDETTAMVDYLVNQRFVSRISILYQNDTFGQAGYTALNGSLAALGLNFHSEGSYVRNTEDVDAAYQSILGGNTRPQAVVMFGTFGPLAKFVSLTKQADSSIIFITVSFVNAESFVDALTTSGTSLSEVYISEAIPLHSNGEPYLIKEYERALLAYNASAVASTFSFEGYVTGRLVIDIMSQAYPDITHENFLNVLVSSQYFTLSGLLLGPYSKSCNQGMRSVSLLKIDTNGTLINMPETKYSWDTCLSSNGDVVPPIVFGQSAPLLAGSVMDLGVGMRQGILSSFLARNKQGGVRNRKLVLLSRNDGYEPEPAAENANYFIQERDVFGLVGSVGTAPSEAILPTINEYSVPFIGALSGASSLRSPCNHNIVNVRASYIDEVAAMTQHFIDNLGLRRLSIFYQNDGFGSAGLEGLQLALSNRSMEIESRGTYERNTLDLAEGFSSIQQGDPEAIVLIGTYEQLAKFIQMALEWKSDLVFGTVSFVDSEAFASSLRAVQVSTDNIYVTQVVPDPTDDGNQLVALYQNAMLARDASSTFGFVSLEGYVVAEFLIKVLDSIDSTLDITRETFLDTVFSQTIFLVGGQAIGPFSGSAGNCTCNQGLHRIVTTRISSSSNYSLAEVPENAFKFDTCGVQYPENFVPVSDGVRGGIIAAACACVGAAITFIVLSVYHRESKTIKHSSLTFSLMTLVGAAFMMFSPVFIVLVVPQCMVWLWFVCIGFILFFGSMAVKSYRIDRIFNWHRKKLTKIKPIGDSQLMVVVSVLLGLEVILLILWQFFGELRPLEFEGTNDAIFGCYSDNAFPFIITQICYFGVVFLVGCFFAFRTRNVNFGSYKETKEIFFAVYNMTLLFIIIIPLVALIGVNDTSTAAIITSIGLLFSTLVSILCLYVLKFYRIINKREKLSTSSQTGTGSNVGGSTGRSKVSNIVGSGSARAESINEQYKSSDTTKDIDRLSSKN